MGTSLEVVEVVEMELVLALMALIALAMVTYVLVAFVTYVLVALVVAEVAVDKVVSVAARLCAGEAMLVMSEEDTAVPADMVYDWLPQRRRGRGRRCARASG